MPISPSEFENLLQQAQRPVLGYLIRRTGSLHAAQDILQSANVTAIAKRSSFRTGTNFVAWLRQIAINHYRNDVRKAASMRSATLDEAGLEEVVERQHRARLESEQAQNKWAQLSECLHLLPEHQQDVVQRFYFQGHSLQQLSESLGRTPNAVGQTLHRARLTLIRCVRQKMATAAADLSLSTKHPVEE